MPKFFQPLILALTVLFLSGCINTRYLQENERLYTGANVNIETKENIPNRSELKLELSRVLLPKPNTKFLVFTRPGLWFYNIAGTPKKEGGFRYWLKYKIGEPPVLFNHKIAENTKILLLNRLQNNGYFEARVESKVIVYGRKAKIEYFAYVTSPYLIDSISFEDSVATGINLSRFSRRSLIVPGEPYSLDNLKAERLRIDEMLKNRGHFFFDPDFILFQVDTNAGDKKLHVHYKIKPEIPQRALQYYKLSDIYVLSDYTLERDTFSTPADTIHEEGYHYIQHDSVFKHRTILRSVFLKKGDLYTRTNHNLTLSRLMGLGTFKFVSVRFREQDSLNAIINGYIYLTPLKSKSFNMEFELISKSNSFAGPGFRVGFKHRNLFRGAELFGINLKTSYETFIAEKNSGLNSYELGLETYLQLPKIIAPIKIEKVYNPFVPKTQIRLSFNYLSRVDYFTLASFSFIYGYNWRQTARKEHTFNPISINYIDLLTTENPFQVILSKNPILERSYQEQFIIGSSYSYTYDNQRRDAKTRNYAYFNTNLDLSGNSLYLLSKLIAGNVKPPYELFGVAFSQFVRVDADLRYYWNLNRERKIACRVLAGIGIPYWNSTVLPYTKQFYIGGTNSIRAFRARSIGPGSYKADAANLRTFFFDQTGDMKLEANLEYRFPIYALFKGAVFMDAGNVWLVRNDTARVGGYFGDSFNKFAVGAGAGVRIDASIFVIRFDAGIPLITPYVRTKDNTDSFVLNIAIGYPF
jgi:outer membrane protein insertion porin family